jgi:hypothetical protein
MKRLAFYVRNGKVAKEQLRTLRELKRGWLRLSERPIERASGQRTRGPFRRDLGTENRPLIAKFTSFGVPKIARKIPPLKAKTMVRPVVLRELHLGRPLDLQERSTHWRISQ